MQGMRAMLQMRRALMGGASAVLLLACAPSSSWAQIGSIGGTDGPAIGGTGGVAGHADVFAKPNREYSALPVGSWLLYPTVFGGAVFDSNINQSAVDKTSSAGVRLVPSILAETTDGIHKSTFYGMADARAYARSTANDSDVVNARTGWIQAYHPTSDLTVTGQGDYTRQKDLFSNFGIDHSVSILNPTSIGLSPVANPLTYNQFAGNISAQKTIDRAFVNFGGSVVDIIYDHNPNAVAPSPNGTTYTGTGRGGFWFTPFLYGYVEGAADQRRYSVDQFNSTGYRTVGGVGTDQIGLFRGEIYGGYQSERHDFSPLGTVNGTVAGGKIYYYPLREMTIAASVDESLGVSFLAVAPGAVGSSTRATTALLQATYAVSREWATSARFGYIRTDYVGADRRDNAWSAGGTVTYSVWLNFGLALDYQHLMVTSNVPFQGFTRDVVTLGGTYKY
jgi:hypothetical protein